MQKYKNLKMMMSMKTKLLKWREETLTVSVSKPQRVMLWTMGMMKMTSPK